MTAVKILKGAGAIVAVVAVYAYVLTPLFGQAGMELWTVLSVTALVIAVPTYLFLTARDRLSDGSSEEDANSRRSSAPFWGEVRSCEQCGTATELEGTVSCRRCGTILLRPGEMKVCPACRKATRGDWRNCEWCGEELTGEVYRGS